MLEEFTQLYETQFKKKFPWCEWRIKYIACYLAANMTHNCVYSCLAHVINLGTQVLICTYSKAPHYKPHNPHAHEPDTTMHHEHDEIGLIRSICVKVIDFSLHTMIYWFFQRSDLLWSARNYTKQSKSRLASPALHNSFWIWRFIGCWPMWWLIMQKPIKRWVMPSSFTVHMMFCFDWFSIAQQHVNVFVYEMGLQEQDLMKWAKIDFLRLAPAEWTRVGKFTDLLSVSYLRHLI